MGAFSSGEIAVIRQDAPYLQSDIAWDAKHHVIGTECEIIRLVGSDRFGARYMVRFHDGRTGGVSEMALRKRQPPEERGSWSEIEKLTNWNPTRVHA